MTEPAAINASMKAKEWVTLLVMSVVWGGSFLFNAIALKEVPVLTVVLARVGLGAIFLWLTVLFVGLNTRLGRREWLALLTMGILNNVIPFTLIIWSQKHLAAGLASILIATTPLFTVFVAHYFTHDERLAARKIVGVMLGLVGTAILIGWTAVATLGVDLIAQLACLGAALSYACAGVYGRRFTKLGIPPLVTAAGQVTASTLMLLPLVLAIDTPWLLPMPSWMTIGALVGIGTISTAFAYVLFFRVLAAAGATNLVLVTFLVPVSAIILGILVLGEHLLAKHILGMVFIGLGLAAIDGRPWRFLLAKLQGSRIAPSRVS